MKMKDRIKDLKNFRYKILFIVVIIGLALSTVFAQQQTPAQKPYTVMVYMNPSDLESGGFGEGSTNMLKMLAAQIDEKNMNVIVEIGGTKEWINTYALNMPFRKKGENNPPYIEAILPESQKQLPSWFNKEIDPNKNIRYKIENGDFKKLEAFDKKSIGESDTLSSFINYSMTNFPAEKYALVFWGHAHGATRGFGYDENFNFDTLTMSEMKNALENSTVKREKLEFILFDACYMANLEVAYTLKDYANYLVASADTTNFGMAYHKWLAELSQSPDMPTEQIAKSICDSYNEMRDEYHEWELSRGSTILEGLPQTLSIIKLDAVEEVANSLEQLFHTYAGLKQQNFNDSVERSVKKTTFIKQKELNHMDLKDFVEQLELEVKPTNAAIDALKAALGKVVVYNTPNNNEIIANGLTIYMPVYEPPLAIDLKDELELYKQLKFAPSYTQYIEQVIDTDNSK